MLMDRNKKTESYGCCDCDCNRDFFGLPVTDFLMSSIRQRLYLSIKQMIKEKIKQITV